jgi:hypothetical protein
MKEFKGDVLPVLSQSKEFVLDLKGSIQSLQDMCINKLDVSKEAFQGIFNVDASGKCYESDADSNGELRYKQYHYTTINCLYNIILGRNLICASDDNEEDDCHSSTSSRGDTEKRVLPTKKSKKRRLLPDSGNEVSDICDNDDAEEDVSSESSYFFGI